MAQAAPPTGFNFDHASLNLAPQQPSRVRRAWERVPIKAAQRKDRTVWKRSEPKPLQYETEQGGTGFSVQGTKRLRTKNVPAFPVKAGRGIDREQEAEATDDELFSRRRKSGRRSSIHPIRKAVPSPKSRLISAPRPSRLSTNPQRSPFKNLRVMELSQSPRGDSKKARPSIGGVLGNGTPMRNAFAEPSWVNRSPIRAPLSPKKDLSPQNGFSARMASPSKLFSPQKEQSPQKLFTPQKVFSQSAFPSFEPLAPRLSPHMDKKTDTPSTAQISTSEPIAMVNSQDAKFGTPEQPQPRRRSARLSNTGVSGNDLSEQPAIMEPIGTKALDVFGLTGTVWLPPPETHAWSAGVAESTSPVQAHSVVAPEEPNDEIDEPSLQLQAELGAPISPAKIAMFPKQGKAEQVEDEDQTKLFNDINATFEAKDTPERITSPRKRSPQKMTEQALHIAKTQSSSPEGGSPGLVALHDDNEQLADFNGEDDEVSEDELTARLEDWTDPAIMSPGKKDPIPAQTRSAPRLSDDTSILKAFLSRAQAKRDAQALTVTNKSPVRASPRRSPRRALESVDGNSPSLPKSPTKAATKPPTKIDQKARLGNTPPRKPQLMLSFDPDESDELASPAKTIRRSTRPKPTTQYKTAPSLIPLRRPDGQEPPRLRKTEAQELAIVTRSNTRRNRGQAQTPLMVLQDLSARELSPIKSRPSLPGTKTVDWNAELVEYFGEETKGKAKAKTGVKRSKGLGTVNGTPARSRTALRPEASSNGASAAGATPARPRPRRAPGQ